MEEEGSIVEEAGSSIEHEIQISSTSTATIAIVGSLRLPTMCAFAGDERGERVFQHRCSPLWQAMLSSFL